MKPPSYIVLAKFIGQTPLEVIEAWKAAHPEYRDIPMTYAGRLDPLASGKLLVLLGDECKKRDAYLGLDKEYVVEVVLDAATDTGDTLGLARILAQSTHPDSPSIKNALHTLRGTHEVPYPAFSSKTVNGIPLFQYALEGTLDRIAIPVHKETFYKVTFVQREQLTNTELSTRIHQQLQKVPRSDLPSKKLGADFRQDEIRAVWEKEFGNTPPRMFTVITVRITCASGAYMRTFTERLGKALGTEAFALSIHRSKIGIYRTLGRFSLWTKTYT